jgi:hypothetical protein
MEPPIWAAFERRFAASLPAYNWPFCLSRSGPVRVEALVACFTAMSCGTHGTIGVWVPRTLSLPLTWCLLPGPGKVRFGIWLREGCTFRHFRLS